MATAAEKRRADRERKRAEREARKRAGVPEPAVLDKALVDAVRDAMERKRWRIVRLGGEELVESFVSMRIVLCLARKALLARGLSRDGVNQGLKERFKVADRALGQPAPAPVPPPAVEVDHDAETWACIQSLCAAVEEGETEQA